MQFTKMEGLGNDYIYINCLEAFPEELSALAVRLSDRHFGVGGDGLICIGPGREGDFSMHMFNADGSEPSYRWKADSTAKDTFTADQAYQAVVKLIVEEIPDGACLQLGIGGMPNAVGSMIAESDLKDLGVHTEM